MSTNIRDTQHLSFSGNDTSTIGELSHLLVRSPLDRQFATTVQCNAQRGVVAILNERS